MKSMNLVKHLAVIASVFLLSYSSSQLSSLVRSDDCTQRSAAWFNSLAYKSTDGGATSAVLVDVQRDFVAHKLNKIVIDTLDHATIYLGTNNGVFKSTNEGCSWKESSGGFTERYIRDLVIDPADPSNLYALTSMITGNIYRIPPSHRVFITADRGNNWQAVNLDFELTCLTIDSSNPATLYLGARNQDVLGIYKSTDRGRTFAFLQQIDNAADFAITYIVVDPKDVSVLYYGVNNTIGSFSNDRGGIYRSVDGGTTSARIFHPDDSSVTNSFVIDPDDLTTLYNAGNRGIFKSTDGGRNWQITSISLPTENSLVLDKHSNLYFSIAGPVCGSKYGCPSFLSRSTDGGRSWSRVPALINSSLVVDPSNTSILYCAGFIPPPELASVSITGKRVVVEGSFIHEGTVIKVNGERQKTEFRPLTSDFSYVRLVSKKGAKNVAPGQVVLVSVEEADGVEVSVSVLKPN